MTKELVIKKTDIDWLEVIEMVFNRKGWGNTYTLYQCEESRIVCSMEDFNFTKSYGSFKIECIYKHDKYSESYKFSNFTYAVFFIKNFSIEEFEALVYRRIRSLLDEIIKGRTLLKAKEIYKDLEKTEYNINNKLIEQYDMSQDDKEIEELSNIHIREDARKSFNERLLELSNEEFEKEVTKYCDTNRNSFLGLDNILEKIAQLIEKRKRDD